MDKEVKLKHSIMEIYKKRIFELMFNTAKSFSENNFITWIIVLTEWVQLTFFPLRRSVFLSYQHI